MEFRQYSLDYADTFAQMRNNPNVLDNGYDKTPNPFTKQDGIDFINIQLDKNPSQIFFIFYDNELAGEIGITIQDDVHRLCAEIGYFIAEKGRNFYSDDEKMNVGLVFTKKMLENPKSISRLKPKISAYR